MNLYQNTLTNTITKLSDTGLIKLSAGSKTFTLKIDGTKTKHKFEIIPIMEKQKSLIQKIRGVTDEVYIEKTIDEWIKCYQKEIEILTPEEKYLTNQLFSALIEAKKNRQEETAALENKWESLKLKHWCETDAKKKKKRSDINQINKEDLSLIAIILCFLLFLISAIDSTSKDRKIESLKEQIKLLEDR